MNVVDFIGHRDSWLVERDVDETQRNR